MRIAVIGLGKIGLPLAAQFADSGHDVVGVDVNHATVATINRGDEPFPGEAHLQDRLERLVLSGRLRATTDYGDAVPLADAVVVVVPLFVDADGVPDFGWMDSATADIARHLTPGTLISFETTLPVGTTRTRWKPMLESGSSLVEGRDFHVVFSPERVLTGRVFEDLRKYPKLIGGLSPEGAARARDFYESVLQFDKRPDLARGNGVWDLGSAEAAELAKLAETTYRDVNIGLANQFARFADSQGIDIYQVIEASNSQPFSHIHRPGISVGGHCIPVYPQLYLGNDPGASVVREARGVNASMPEFFAQKLDALLGSLQGRRVAVLGVTYRGAVKETAFTGAFALVEALVARGAVCFVHDPLYETDELKSLGVQPWAGEAVDAAVLHTDHECYRSWTEADLAGATLVLDGRGVLDPSRFRIPVHVIGAGTLP